MDLPHGHNLMTFVLEYFDRLLQLVISVEIFL